MAFASQKVLRSVPETVLQKRFCAGFRQLFFTFVYQIAVAWRVPPTVLHICLPVSSWGQSSMSHPCKSSPQKTTHHVVAVGVFFGLIFSATKDLPTASGITLRVLGDVTPALNVPIAVQSPKDVKVSWRTDSPLQQIFLKKDFASGEIRSVTDVICKARCSYFLKQPRSGMIGYQQLIKEMQLPNG